MAVRAKIIKEAPGFNVGDIKSLTLDVAKNLEMQGICEILGNTPSNTEVIKKAEEATTKANETDKKIEEVITAIEGVVLEKIEPIKVLADSLKSANEGLVADIKGLKSANEGLVADIKGLKSQLEKLKTPKK